MSDTQQKVRAMVDTAILMAQELQEFVDDAIEASGDDNALQGTQELLKDWEKAYADSGLDWQHSLAERYNPETDGILDL